VALDLAAIDQNYLIEVRRDVLDEADGPMLRHGLQGFHGAQLVLPRPDTLKPRRDFLDERYAWFKKAG
jgi:putative restriction endonuclease